MQTNPVHLLDLRGLKCPLPALRTRKRLSELPAGVRMEVWTSDPMSVIDIPHAVSQVGGRLVEQAAVEGGHRFVIERLCAKG